KPKCVRFAEITMRVALSSDDVHELLARLAAVTASTSLQTGTLNEAEIGLAAGWQLAQAMGAQAVLEIDGGKEVCIVLSLPVEMDLQTAPTEDAMAYGASPNGDDVINHSRNGNGKHNGNGYHYVEARAGTNG